MRIVVAVIIAAIIYVIQNAVTKKMWDKNLNVEVFFSHSYVDAGEKSKLYEVIKNGKRLPLPVLHVKFSAPKHFVFDDASNASVTDSYYRNDAFSVMGGQKITRTLEFEARKRGFYVIENINLIAHNFFMTETFAKTIHPMTGLYVFPKKYNDVKFNVMMRQLIGEIETKLHIVEDPYAFRGIREYNSQDTMSKINWKASAKMGSLMVNMYSQTSYCKVKVMLNLDTNIMIKSDYIKELSIELAGSVAKKLIENKLPVMLMTNGRDRTGNEMPVYSEGASEGHLIEIDKQLACIEDNTGVDDFIRMIENEIAKREENTAYVIISSYHKNRLVEKLDMLSEMGINLSMIVPYYDQYMPEVSREYMYGWEVALNDA